MIFERAKIQYIWNYGTVFWTNKTAFPASLDLKLESFHSKGFKRKKTEKIGLFEFSFSFITVSSFDGLDEQPCGMPDDVLRLRRVEKLDEQLCDDEQFDVEQVRYGA